MAGSDQTLPGKEANLFRQIVKFYETKQYKKGLKAADQVLKKFPDHGETLAMKGLTLNCLERKEEAYDLVRKGLKANLMSHVCWHVYGLLYRSDRNYAEAIKCYVNALRQDKDNVQILRDLALLQVQMRDTAGFVETRQKLLQLKPSNKTNWISFAVAHHLNKSFDVAVQVLESYEGTMEGDITPNEVYEHSEMLLYKASILEEAGKYEEALKLLVDEKNTEKIRDVLGVREQKAGLLYTMGHTQDAQAAYRDLIATNPDNTKYHDALLESMGLVKGDSDWTNAQREQLSSLYSSFQEDFPRSAACKRVPLDFKVGDEFSAAAEQYIKKFLQKGIPSLFSDLKGLYTSPPKVAALQQLFEGFEKKLSPGGSGVDGIVVSEPSEEELSDTSTPLVWVWLYLAQHHDRLRDTPKALGYVQKAMDAAPKLIEIYSVHARVLKHAGDLEGAANAADKARSMDLADRYLNSTAAKALFRAGHVETAEKTAALFTKHEDQINSLFDMQCMWYEIECGKAHSDKKAHGKALKNFLAVTKHFADFVEDQFDFHSYCIRKMTLRSYLSMLKLEDQIMSNPFYAKAALSAVAVYLDLHSNPNADEQKAQDEEALMAAMDPAERKRYKAKKRKEEARRRKEAEEAEAAAAAAAAAAAKEKGDKKKGGVVKEKDPDPDGKALAATEDPLGEAVKLMVVLKEHAKDNINTHVAAFEVYSRKGRMLLALQGVKAARTLGGESDTRAFRALVKMASLLKTVPAQGAEGALHPVVHAVIEEEMKSLLGGKELKKYVEDWVAAHGRGSSLSKAIVAAEMLAEVLPAKKAEAIKLLTGWKVDINCSHSECVECHKMLVTALGDSAAGEAFKKAAAKRFQRSTYFEGPNREEHVITAVEEKLREMKI